jgi:PAS domain S-box-containing protein
VSIYPTTGRDRRRLLFAAFLFCFVLADEVAAGPHPADATDRMLSQYAVDNWDTRTGLPQNSALSVAQTDDGYLWIGTEQGLSRFDGKQFVTYTPKNTPRLPGAYIRSLLAARDGSLWIGTPHGLAHRTGTLISSFTTREGLPSNSIHAIFESRDGSIWVATALGVSRMQRGRVETFRSPVATEASVFGIAQTTDGALWFAGDAGLMTIRDGHLVAAGIPRLPQAPARSILADGSALWIGWRGAGVTRFDVRSGAINTTAMPGAQALSLARTGNGAVLVGTDSGLVRMHGSRIERLPHTDPLAKAIVWTIHEDRQGDIWVGTAAMGVFRMKTSHIVAISERQGLSHKVALAVLQAKDGAMWVGTPGGGVNRMRGGTVQHFTTADGLPSNIVLALANGADGSIWLGTPAGLAQFDGVRFHASAANDELSSRIIRTIAVDRDGSMWIGTQGGGVNHLENGRVRVYSVRDGLGSNTINTLRWRRDGTLMVGSESVGLAFIRDGVVTRSVVNDVSVSDIVEDADGTLWLATAERGLARVQRGNVAYYGEKQGLDDTIHALIDDGAGNFWCSSNRGIFRIARTAIDALDRGTAKELTYRAFGTADGMLDPECNGGIDPAVLRDSTGTLWFPTLKGLAGIDPAHLPIARPPARPIVQRIAIDGNEQPLTSALELDRGTHNIEISYNTIDLAAPELLSFRYQLDGFDKAWVEAGDRRTAYYTQLPAGRYDFRVQAKGRDGLVSAPAAVRVIVKPRFFETVTFQGLAIVAVLLIILGLDRWRTTALRHRNAELMLHMRERERAENEVRRSEERFRSLIENASDITAVVSEDGMIRYVSPSATRILGYEIGALIGRPVRDFVDRNFRLRDFIARIRESNTAQAESFRVRRADDEWVWLEVVAKHGVDADGTNRVIVNCRDTTERVLLQQQLEQASRMSSLGRLAATVSHEFNNVLMGIQPFVSVLQRHARGDERVQNITANIETSVKRGKQITAQILRFTRPTEPSIDSIPLHEWLNGLVPELRGLLPAVDIDVNIDLPSDVMIAGDRTQLAQAMMNLAVNARDAMMPGSGRLQIRCSQETNRRFPFGVVEDPERFIHLEVTDNGQGIAAEVLPHIFEPLFTTKRERGTGLGLAVVHHTITHHRGLIFVDSEVDAGTTVHLFLPKVITASRVIEAARVVTPAIPLSLRRVLIVEDELAVAEGLAGLLRLHEIEVRVVDHAGGAASAMLAFRPDALILDVALPDGDGVDLYRSLMVTRPRLPVIFSTAHENRERLGDLLEHAHVSFLQKPYSEADLVGELARCIAAASWERAS